MNDTAELKATIEALKAQAAKDRKTIEALTDEMKGYMDDLTDCNIRAAALEAQLEERCEPDRDRPRGGVGDNTR